MVEGTWRWKSDNALLSNGATIVESSVAYCPGLPNLCCELAGDDLTDCLVVNYDAYRKYHDHGCHNLLKYICEHPSVLLTFRRFIKDFFEANNFV